MPFLQCAGMERVRVRVELRPLQLREQLPAQPALPLQTQWGGGSHFLPLPNSSPARARRLTGPL